MLDGYMRMLPKDNPASWRYIHEFIDEFPEHEYWSKWKQMARTVLSALQERGLAEHFRVGQSMHQIIFSTADHHGLTTEPRVTLEFYPKEQQVRVAYSHANIGFNKPDSEERVDMPSATACALRYLRRLWSESRSDIQIPDALNAV